LLQVLLIAACGSGSPDPQTARNETKPNFGELVTQLSEPQGFFDSDNLISNETDYLHIVGRLPDLGIRNGVYLGVGPDQNFTYIARIRPKYAFIIDIRRGNMIQHLLYKAIFELAPTRQEFLSILFSKPMVDADAKSDAETIGEIVARLDRIPGDSNYLQQNTQRVKSLVGGYGIPLNPGDLDGLEQILATLYTQHLDLRWEWRSPWRRGVYFPRYREILLAREPTGAYGNFLNDKEEYDYLRDLQADNQIVPVVGNFAGKHTLKEIANYIKVRKDFVSAFYLSNVEYYLLPDGVMHQFAMNVRRLPVADNSVLIRAFVNARWGNHPARVGRHMMTTVMQYMTSFNEIYAAGRYRTYWDVGTIDYIPAQEE